MYIPGSTFQVVFDIDVIIVVIFIDIIPINIKFIIAYLKL